MSAAIYLMPAWARLIVALGAVLLLAICASGARHYVPELRRVMVCADCRIKMADRTDGKRLPGHASKSSGGGRPTATVVVPLPAPRQTFPFPVRLTFVGPRVPVADRRLTLRRKLELLVGGHGRLGAG